MKALRLIYALRIAALLLPLALASSPVSAGPNAPTHDNGDQNTAGTLTFHSSTSGNAIPAQPRVYVVYWGTAAEWGAQSTDSDGNLQFAKDTGGNAASLQAFFKGLGTNGEQWSNILTQYCDGPLVGGTCDSSPHVRYPIGGAWAGTWHDTTDSSVVDGDSDTTDAALDSEIVRAATHFGNTAVASNRYVLYVIVFPPGSTPIFFTDSGTDDECSGHGYTDLANGDHLSYAMIPYISDNANCKGAFTIEASHEYAEAVTDIVPGQGWTYKGVEIADGCPNSFNLTLSTGTFKVTQLWSNQDNGCVGSDSQNLSTGGSQRPYAEALDDDSIVTDSGVSASSSFPIYYGANGTGQGGYLIYYIVSNPSHGSVTITDQSAGTYVYKPSAGFSGTDSFTFDAEDSAGNFSNTATSNISVQTLEPPHLMYERTQCNNGADSYLIEWGPGSSGNPTQYDVEYSEVSGTWGTLYDGPRTLATFGAHEGTVVNFRARAYDGLNWSGWSTMIFTAASCIVQ